MISVAMATYNGENYIISQLDSIRQQTKKVDEIVVVDDCSTDQTPNILQTYAQQYPEMNIQLHRNSANLGYKRNFQRAMSLCEGDIIFLCDQDDIWMDTKVEAMTTIMNIHPEISVLSSAFVQIDGKGEIIATKKVYDRRMKDGEMVSVPLEDLIYHNISQGCAMVIRESLKEQYLQSCEEDIPHDWVINVLGSMQKSCYFLNSPLFYYRIHDYNTIGLNDNLSLKTKYTIEVRTKVAKQATAVLDFIERIDEKFYEENKWLSEMNTFSKKHIVYMNDRKLLGILLQNFQPYYKKLKSFSGRLLDLFFVISK